MVAAEIDAGLGTTFNVLFDLAVRELMEEAEAARWS